MEPSPLTATLMTTSARTATASTAAIHALTIITLFAR
jgi:hypothetical protein